jgi:hypothetical protein
MTKGRVGDKGDIAKRLLKKGKCLFCRGFWIVKDKGVLFWFQSLEHQVNATDFVHKGDIANCAQRGHC